MSMRSGRFFCVLVFCCMALSHQISAVEKTTSEKGAGSKAVDLIGEKIALKVEAEVVVDGSDEKLSFDSVFLPCYPKLSDGDKLLVETVKGDAWVKDSFVVPWSEADAYFTGIIKADGKKAGAYVARGLIRAENGMYKEAVEDHTVAVKLQPENPQCHVNRSLSLSELGRFKEAIADIKTAQKLSPEDLAVMGNAAWLLATVPDASLRDAKEAVTLATKVCELTEFQDLNWLDTLAAAQANAGEFEAAIKWQSKALEGEPENDEWKSRLKLYLDGKPFRLTASESQPKPVKD